jgi:hypothetical protein
MTVSVVLITVGRRVESLAVADPVLLACAPLTGAAEQPIQGRVHEPGADRPGEAQLVLPRSTSASYSRKAPLTLCTAPEPLGQPFSSVCGRER